MKSNKPFSKTSAVAARFVLAFCLLFALIADRSAFAASSGSDAVERLNAAYGVNFKSGAYVSREEFSAFAAFAFGVSGGDFGELPFEDKTLIDPENRDKIAALYATGALSGTYEDGKLYMKPNDNIKRQEAFAILGKTVGGLSSVALPYTDAADIAPWAREYIAWFAENKIISGYPGGGIFPNEPLKTDHFAVIMLNAASFTGNSISNAQAYKGQLKTAAGMGMRGFSDGNAQTAAFDLPGSVFTGTDGAVYVIDSYNNAIRKLSGGKVGTLSGKWLANDENGFSKGFYLDGKTDAALFDRPADAVRLPNGDIYVCDSQNHVIRLLRANNVYTFSGTVSGFADGAGDAAKFNTPMAIAADNYGNLYVADALNNCIRKIDGDGFVTTVAGQPKKDGFADGKAKSALFSQPQGIAVNGDGSVIYVADTGNQRIRKIEGDNVTTAAGGQTAKDGDGRYEGGYVNGRADIALLNLPTGLSLADDGTLFIADSANCAIRALTKNGSVVTVAGSGDSGDSDGELNHPTGVCYANGYLYIADTFNNRIKSMRIDLNM